MDTYTAVDGVCIDDASSLDEYRTHTDTLYINTLVNHWDLSCTVCSTTFCNLPASRMTSFVVWCCSVLVVGLCQR